MITKKCVKSSTVTKQGFLIKNSVYSTINIIYSCLELSQAVVDKAKDVKIELKAYSFPSKPEQVRNSRIVRVGIFQNSIPVPTWTNVKKARDAFYEMAKEVLAIAAMGKVNIFCFQEAWGE